MKTTHIFLIPIAIFWINIKAFGQDYKTQFEELFYKQDFDGLKSLLERWEESDQNDPELYVAWYNYHVNQSMQEVVKMGTQPPATDDYLEIMDTDSVSDNPAAYMYSEIEYDPEMLQKGFSYIDRGIELHPARLDMRFGKVYMLGQTGEFEKFKNEIINTVKYSATIGHKWLWTNNEEVEDTEDVLLGSIQDYQYQLYSSGDDLLLSYMEEIAVTIMEYFPDNVVNMSNIGVVNLIRGDLDKALVVFLLAETFAPTDVIILSNIAYTYLQKGEREQALKYYYLIIEHGNLESQEFARDQIEMISNSF